MKTAMQTMLTYIKAVESDEFNQDIEYIKENCIQLLEKEKQQIIKSFYDGCFDTNSWRAEQYYDETFKNE